MLKNITINRINRKDTKPMSNRKGIAAIIPFFSTQNKETGKFLLNSCCTTHISSFLAKKLSEIGFNVRVEIPAVGQLHLPGDMSDDYRLLEDLFSNHAKYAVHLPIDNVHQRLSFAATPTAAMVQDADLVISHNEINSTRIRRLMKPTGKLIQFNHLLPVGVNEWMLESQVGSWRACDAVIFLSKVLRSVAYSITQMAVPTFHVWPMVYSDIEAANYLTGYELAADREPKVLFPHRASENNYTHHEEFIKGFHLFKEWEHRPLKKTTGNETNSKGVFFDPTHYLRKTRPDLETFNHKFTFVDADTRAEYWDSLRQMDCFVGLMADDLHGGVSIREAMRAGVIPILLKTPAYVNLLKETGLQDELGKYMFDFPTAESISSALKLYSEMTGNEIRQIRRKMVKSIQIESYEAAWSDAQETLSSLNNPYGV
jgi:hypothetical protein